MTNTFNFFDIIKAIYQKTKVDFTADTSLCLIMTKVLSREKNNLPILKQILQYQFYIEPQHYFYLLFLGIPKQYRVPFFKKIAKEKPKTESKVVEKIKYVLGWSQREVELNREIIDKIILPEQKYWKMQLGIK